MTMKKKARSIETVKMTSPSSSSSSSYFSFIFMFFLCFGCLICDMLLFCGSNGMKQHIFISNSKRIYVPSSSTIILIQFKSFGVWYRNLACILKLVEDFILFLFSSSFIHANFILEFVSCECSNLCFELFYN